MLALTQKILSRPTRRVKAVVIMSCIHSLACSVGRLTIPIVHGVLLDQVTRGTYRNSSQYFDTMHHEFPTAVSIRIIDWAEKWHALNSSARSMKQAWG